MNGERLAALGPCDQRAGAGELGAVPRAARRRADRGGPQRVLRSGERQRPLRPRHGLVADPQVRELAHRRRQPQHQVGVAVGEGPLERGAQVVVVGEHPFHPGLFVGAPQREGGFLGQLGVVPGVRPGHRVEITAEAPAAVRAQRLQHPVARAVARALGDDQRAVDEPGEQVDGGVLVGVGQAHPVRGPGVAAAREHREPREQLLLGIGQQAEGPVDGRREAAVPARPGPGPRRAGRRPPAARPPRPGSWRASGPPPARCPAGARRAARRSWRRPARTPDRGGSPAGPRWPAPRRAATRPRSAAAAPPTGARPRPPSVHGWWRAPPRPGSAARSRLPAGRPGRERARSCRARAAETGRAGTR